MSHELAAPRIGVLWRADERDVEGLPRADRDLAPLYDEFAKLGAELVPVPYRDTAVDEARERLRNLDGVLVWVNPIQDGADRSRLDPLLREASAQGVWVSAHPDVILQIGTKEILHRTRHLGWGTEAELYRSAVEFAEKFPERLARAGRLVLKQARGNGGNGVWKIELPGGHPGPADLATQVRIQDARPKDGSFELVPLEAFMQRCEAYFAWSGALIDQAYQDRLADGMVRCYFSGTRVVGFCRQYPKGLLDDPSQGPAASSVMHGPETADFQGLRAQAETEWVPQMVEILDIEPRQLPVIWDADFLFGPKTEAGEDTWVLCEINASAVWPFPREGAPIVAEATLEQIRTSRAKHVQEPAGTGGGPITSGLD